MCFLYVSYMHSMIKDNNQLILTSLKLDQLSRQNTRPIDDNSMSDGLVGLEPVEVEHEQKLFLASYRFRIHLFNDQLKLARRMTYQVTQLD